MEWNGDPSWWQDGVVPLQSIEAPVSPVSAAVISVDGAAVSQPALDARSTPDSSKLNVKVAKVSKKYHSEPPAKRQPYFEFLVSFLLAITAHGMLQLHASTILVGQMQQLSSRAGSWQARPSQL